MPRSAVRVVAGLASLVISHWMFPAPAAGQARAFAEIRGLVRTPSEVPVPGAEVSVLGDSLSALTDSDGRFVLKGVPPGVHVVRVRRIGYRAQYLAATLHAGEQQEVTIALTPGVYELPELAVTARLAKPIEYAWTTKYDEFFRRKLVGLGRYISRQDIDKKAAAHTVELLLGVPGVQVYLGMPGVSPDGVRFSGCKTGISVWMDGWELRPVPGEGVGELLERILPLQIEMIEVYTGPARMQAEHLGNSCGTIAIWTR
jgi:hypothetical protein